MSMIPSPVTPERIEEIRKRSALQQQAQVLGIVDFNERKQEFFCRACRYRDPLGPDGNKLHDDDCPWLAYLNELEKVEQDIRDLLSALSASQAALAMSERLRAEDAHEHIRNQISDDKPENTTDNPKSWIAWKRRAEQAEAALAAQGQAQGHGKMPENVSVGQREGGGVQIEGHTLAEDWELTLDADGNVELFDRVRVVYKLPAVPGAGAGEKP